MSEIPVIQFSRLRPERDADIPLPRYMTRHSAGMDICAAVETAQLLAPGSICLIPTGFAVAIPAGFEIQIRPRSGLALKHGITLINSPGTIDADYRGEVMIALANFGGRPYSIRRGDRIAQLIVQRVYQARLKVVAALDETGRNSGGFGHTGR